MAVLQETKLTLGASNNGSDTDALQLFQTATKVFVKFGDGVSGTLTYKEGIDEEHLINRSVPEADAWNATITASTVFMVSGPGVIAFGCADTTGEIEIVIEESMN